MASLSVGKSCIRNNHSKGRFLVLILSKSEVKINVDGRTRKRKI
nr:MAG TPA: hypothetical protein [Caudoviricetes sp.]